MQILFNFVETTGQSETHDDAGMSAVAHIPDGQI
jgi:hypothetical protein